MDSALQAGPAIGFAEGPANPMVVLSLGFGRADAFRFGNVPWLC